MQTGIIKQRAIVLGSGHCRFSPPSDDEPFVPSEGGIKVLTRGAGSLVTGLTQRVWQLLELFVPIAGDIIR
jgi:hypothetical protein